TLLGRAVRRVVGICPADLPRIAATEQRGRRLGARERDGLRAEVHAPARHATRFEPSARADASCANLDGGRHLDATRGRLALVVELVLPHATCRARAAPARDTAITVQHTRVLV